MRIAIPAVALHVVLTAFVAWTSPEATETSAAGTLRDESEAAVASFDCAHATSPREKAICGDPALSALDGRLGRLYRERRALLSPQGAKLLQNSERNWLRFVGLVCSSDGPESKLWLNRKFCLTRQYNERIEQIQEVAQKVGPYLFNRIDLYRAQPSGDETGSSAGFYVQHVAYPQIDRANSPQLRVWNQNNVHDLPGGGDCGPGDYDVNYEIGYANAYLISVRWTYSSYCHGTPHGFFSLNSKNSVLSPRLRPLTAADLFGSGKAWVSVLKERFWTALAQTGWRPPDNMPSVKPQLKDDFVQPDRWLFTEDGLQVAFASYEGGCYVCTPQPVTVPWSELKPLLSKSAIAP